MSKILERPQVKIETIDRAKREIDEMLAFRLLEKGYGAFASTHEMRGSMDEEFCELREAMHKKDRILVKDELKDVAVCAIFSLACILEYEQLSKEDSHG